MPFNHIFAITASLFYGTPVKSLYNFLHSRFHGGLSGVLGNRSKMLLLRLWLQFGVSSTAGTGCARVRCSVFEWEAVCHVLDRKSTISSAYVCVMQSLCGLRLHKERSDGESHVTGQNWYR